MADDYLPEEAIVSFALDACFAALAGARQALAAVEQVRLTPSDHNDLVCLLGRVHARVDDAQQMLQHRIVFGEMPEVTS